MHSYNEVNRLYKEEADECIKRGIRPGTNYPENINLDDFWFYLVAPVLVYELDFPKYPSRDWMHLLQKILLTLCSLVSNTLKPRLTLL